MRTMRRIAAFGALALASAGIVPEGAAAEDTDYECITVTITTTRTITYSDGSIRVLVSVSSVTQCRPI